MNWEYAKSFEDIIERIDIAGQLIAESFIESEVVALFRKEAHHG
jgi:hypothetical protein